MPEQLPCQKDPEAWFLESEGAQRRAAHKCGPCPIKHQCAIRALEDGIPFGVWGGLTPEQRAVVWSRVYGGRPSKFRDDLDAAIGYLQNTRRRPLSLSADWGGAA